MTRGCEVLYPMRFACNASFFTLLFVENVVSEDEMH